MDIAQIRAKYPQYSDLSDKQLADALYGKFYSDMPIGEYYKRIGFAPETTILGQVKEGFKGLVPGAVGLVESAATGASALLPEQYEKAAREKIASVAGAAKAPFAAAPGYEETVGRKLGEAVGSTVPFLAAGPLGLAGRIGAVGLGVGAGAGEARTRAEKEGATAEQRSTATALGVIPGAMEIFAPFRILSRIPDAATAQGVQLVKRALIAGGEEAAQEAASGFAQNLIARGVYKPEQELIEGLGEQAAYGGATGAIVQGLMDLALGRRARGAAAPPPGAAPAAPGTPGETPIERAAREAAEKAAAAPPPAPTTPPEPPALPEGAPPVEPTPPVAETPAPPAIPEPKVRKPGELAPLPDVLDSDTIKTIGFTRGKIHDALVGKSITDPEIRTVLEGYKDRPTASAKTAAKIDAFLARLPEPVLAPVAETAPPAPPPVVEATAPAVPPVEPTVETPVGAAPITPETPSAPSVPTEPEAGGAGAPVAGGPAAVTPTEGVGAPEPTGVVPPVADAGQPAGGEGAKPAAVVAPTITTPAAEAPVTPKEKVLKGSVENRVKALNVNAAQGGVPDPKVIRSTLESINEPKMARAVLYYLGVDQDGNFLVGANNLPQTPSAQEAGQMAGLGENSGDRVKKVAKALGITGDIRKKYQASQTDILVTGAAVSESGTGADVEPAKTGLITEQTWYEPIARKGIGQANDTELARAAVRADRFLENRDNEPTHAAIMAEVQNRAKRPEFRSALKKEFGIASEEATVEEGTPGTEAGVEEEGDVAELPQRPTPGVVSPAITEAVTRGDTKRTLQAVRETPEATPLDHLVAQRFLGLGQFLGLPKIETRPADQVKGSAQYDPKTDTISIADGQEDTHTVLHETTHAFVHKLIVANEKGLRNDEGYRDLKKLYDFLNTKYPTLKSEYGMSSLTEFASEAMSNPQFQKKLGTIRYQTRPAWTQFVEAVRKLLKIGAGDSSALTEAMAGVDSLLRVGREYQTKGPAIEAGVAGLITPEATAAAAKADAIGERKQTTLTEKVGRELQGNTALRLREKFTDSMAALEDFFVNAYGGQIRTAGGRLNPMVLLSRALDALRVSKAVQEQGGLGRQDGLIVATELKNDKGESISYQGVLKRIADAAKAEGKTYEEYQKTIDNVLYGHREFNLRERNKTLDADEQVDLLLDDKQIDALEAAFQKDEFIKGISADLDAIRFNLLDTLVETGRISEEQAQDYKDAIGYIPFERIGDYENAWTGATRGANRGVAALKKMRKLEGSNRKSTSVVENFSGLVDWATKEAMKNEAASRAMDDMLLLGAAKRGPKPATDSPGGEVQVFKDGKMATFYVPDPAHFVAFSIADPQLSKILKAMQRGSQLLRAGVTSMPPFAIKQVFDDVVRAYTYAGVKNNTELVKNVLFNFPKNWMNEILKRKPKGIRELESLGIVGTFDFSQQGGNLRNILEGAGAKKEGLGSAILRVMEAGAKASDVAVREAVYKQVLKETGDKAQAESAAREIINFSRRGSSKMMGQMISIIPFFNAYARGMDKLATAAAGKVVGQTTGTARSMFYKRMTVLTTMGLTYALMMQDDDEYNKLPDHVRDTNWVLPYGKELGFTPVIPIPADLAFFFKAIPERLVRYYKYQGTDEERTAMEVLGELTKRGIDVFSSPNITPQILRPFAENIFNYSMFLGRPLESQAQLKLRPFERYGTGTSDAMKALAGLLEDAANATGMEAFAISPIKLENAVRGLLGSAAGLGLSMADMMVNPDRTDRPLHQQLAPQLTGAAAVMKNPVGTRYMDEIYSLENRVEQVYTTYNRLAEKEPEKAEKFLDDNIGMYEIRGAVRTVMEEIRRLNKMAMDIDKDTTLSPEQRRKEIDELRAEQNEIARVVFSLRKEARDIQMGL